MALKETIKIAKTKAPLKMCKTCRSVIVWYDGQCKLIKCCEKKSIENYQQKQKPLSPQDQEILNKLVKRLMKLKQ